MKNILVHSKSNLIEYVFTSKYDPNINYKKYPRQARALPIHFQRYEVRTTKQDRQLY